jgi:uncharacterized membrane protein
MTAEAEPAPAGARVEDDETGSDVGRVLALSDGVFAIALTVLVLEIALPRGTTGDDLGHALASLGPKYAAYALSFLTIGTFWLIHRLSFRRIVRTNMTLLVLNLLLLMGVAFLPFPTAVLGQFGGRTTATVFYGCSMAATSLVSSGIWWYVSGPGRALIDPRTDPEWIRMGRLRSVVGPGVFLLSIPVATFAPYVAESMWFLVFPLRMAIPRLFGRTAGEDD